MILDFNEFLNVLRGEIPSRPVLFEFLINDAVISHLAGSDILKINDMFERQKIHIKGYHNAGYDYASIYSWETDALKFLIGEVYSEQSRSQNEGALITDRKSFEQYKWPNPEECDYDIYNRLAPFIPEGMKLMACCDSGVLETVVDLVGFEHLCIMSLMDPELTQEIFDAVGSRLLKHYEIVAEYDTVGVVMVNDDWGFKTKTLLDTEAMRRYVFPWHKKIVAAIHKNNKPALLHSCGNLTEVFDDIINDMQYDGKHSYEDGIYTVEEAYQKWGQKITILGGMDMDYLVRSTPEEINKRAKRLVEMGMNNGNYMLGSGNSVPDYVPIENYMDMIDAVKY